jgi:hypothetical protein
MRITGAAGPAKCITAFTSGNDHGEHRSRFTAPWREQRSYLTRSRNSPVGSSQVKSRLAQPKLQCVSSDLTALRE